ncbi:MAG TPA: Re/Si-specific NAD(P)(+) transhydrogenase subunit alpha [Steroidobacteraceae bacterium]|jgi:NAD(P) transhydrogenase subunit alpha|nr:Re/Si-specific NAD(P)(+) transhydrogenase subunit alpha [Steroidobacteraceae bacterium]
MSVVAGILRETAAKETRVAVVPEIATKLKSLGVRVLMERGAGASAHFPDASYTDAEFSDASTILASADILLKVQPPSVTEVAALKKGAIVIGFMQAYARPDLVLALKERDITSFAMELVPRISRAQSMDALSSQASVAGYKAVLIAANTLEKFLPMLTTAAGTIRPASVLVIGAGVAGLQAIATAKRLGAVVEAYDVRSATKDQVKSLGAKFVETGVSAEGAGGYARELTPEEKAKQQEVLDARIAASDAVISTASVPGRAAPRIISRAAVMRMKPGSVIVDMAAEQGGNCELTKPGETVVEGGVKILGPLNLPASLPYHASEMYARNLFNLLKPAIVKGAVAIDWNDEVFAGAVLTRAGEIMHQATRAAIEARTT